MCKQICVWVGILTLIFPMMWTISIPLLLKYRVLKRTNAKYIIICVCWVGGNLWISHSCECLKDFSHQRFLIYYVQMNVYAECDRVGWWVGVEKNPLKLPRMFLLHQNPSLSMIISRLYWLLLLSPHPHLHLPLECVRTHHTCTAAYSGA